MIADSIKQRIRTVRDWPKPGVNFRDVTTLFQSPDGLRLATDGLVARLTDRPIDVVAAVDARGFVIGAAMAYRLGRPFVLIRKKGKLPYDTVAADYKLEYGSATIEVHRDACQPGERVLIVDDLIATGGTLLASVKLFGLLRGVVVGVAAIIDLPDLGGSQRLREAGLAVDTLCAFREDE